MSDISKDICQLILSGEKVSPSMIKKIHVFYYDQNEILYDQFYYFSSELFEKLLLKKKYKIISDADESDFNNLINKHTGTVCVGCFKDYMESIGYNYEL